MSHQSKSTTDHDTIRRWAEQRGGWPAAVPNTGSDGDPGVLRIGFQDDEDLQRLTWEAFFEKFEDSGLAFVYQEEILGSGTSRFFKFVSR